jgi:hypothetical protein
VGFYFGEVKSDICGEALGGDLSFSMPGGIYCWWVCLGTFFTFPLLREACGKQASLFG